MTVPQHMSKQGRNGRNAPNISGDEISEAREKRNAGAVSKYNADTVAILLEQIECGATIPEACSRAKIDESTYHRWRVLIPAFGDALAHAQQHQISARIYKHQHKMDTIDVDTLDPKLAMAHLRKQEQSARMDLEIAKRRDPLNWGDKAQNLNLNVHATSSLDDIDLSKFRLP